MPHKTEHARCFHTSGPVIMKRVYARDAYGFKPCGWLCPDCGQFKPDKRDTNIPELGRIANRMNL